MLNYLYNFKQQKSGTLNSEQSKNVFYCNNKCKQELWFLDYNSNKGQRAYGTIAS